MLPSILAKQLERGISDYIKTSFPMTNEPFNGSLDSLIVEKDALYHEPYVSVKLPFRAADGMPTCFEAVVSEHIPHVHQAIAFERLTGDAGKSTLIATGTGSGKTECFLYPILDYCYRHRGEKGVKALIIYPMNALATDQAKRIAKAINENDKLRGNITAGMYVGGFDRSGKTRMGIDHIITDHETMLNQAPDILLTNYKMLDYMLVRPKDAQLWKDNGPETLKYIAVDELHTFDGAQGTDLACLIRRLKARLMIQAGFLCCIGTSATMGSDESVDDIKNYASEVFGEWFEDDAVITEDRLSPEEFFADCEITEFAIPSKEQIEELKSLIEEDNQDEYLAKAVNCWFPEASIAASDDGRVELGNLLMKHSFAQAAITAMRGKYYQASEIADELRINFPEVGECGDEEALMDSLFALISHARTKVEDKYRPFLYVQVQLWMRELRRLMAEVTDFDLHYSTAHDLNDDQISKYLPVVNCRDCGATGWATVLSPNHDAEIKRLEKFYKLFFEGNTEKITMMFPGIDALGKREGVLDPESLHLTINDGGEMPAGVEVVVPDIEKIGRERNPQYVCPFCGSKRGLAIMGQRGATEISVSLSQMFASKFNDDKKTLAFSDNVQDAAHRAGFFNAKTWRFGIRSAIQRYCENGGAGKNLKEFQEGFIEYWHSMPDEDFVSFFIAPNMTWKKAYEDMLENRKLGDDRLSKKLVEEIKMRLSYEIMLEYGVLSKMGRTLEVSGCSKLAFDRNDIEVLAETVRERAINELGILKDHETAEFQKMVLGYLDLLRSGGAFADDVFRGYVESDGSIYMLSPGFRSWLPGAMSGRNLPRFIAEGKLGAKAKYRFDYINSNKYSDWIQDCAREIWIDTSCFDAISKIIIEEAVKAGVVDNISQKEEVNIYALNKEKIYVTTDVAQIKCYECGTVKTVAVANLDIWQDAPCFRKNCSGIFDESDEAAENYYGKLYSQGDLARINAVEHTGLLERSTREEREIGFKRKEGRQLWDPNVMSCTPTLEMGIDIGDLSTVVLCSMPPAQAQFMQRAGRAGRSDGNSLTLAIANSRPHDLYFYSDPLDMIQGEVAPPKVFLEASAVLERQFRAYCMDSWVKHGVEERDIPQHVGGVLSRFDNRSKTDFPYNFLEYIESYLSTLFNSFIRLFDWKPSDPVPEELKEIAFGDGTKKSSMHLKVLEAFERLKKEREGLQNTQKQLQDMIDEIKAKPKDPSYDEEIKELEKEKKILGSIIKKMSDENVFNFLTDEGLLPNYAFPESGITLRAVLYREKEDVAGSDEKKYDNKVYEYSRSASSAIREFAPNNSFYVEGRKLKVDQVDVATKEIEKWRLCPVCSHMELETAGTSKAYCPNCGSPAWADSGQVRNLLQIKTVYSNMKYSEAQIDDASDDRAKEFYCSQLLVDVDEEHDISCAYQMKNDEFPFGYEFVRKATLRDINFGELAEDNQGEMLAVAGQQNVRKGFQICKYCGKIQPESGAANHSRACKAKKNPAAYPDPFEKCLFLYRQFDTEVLRILIPATTMDISSVRTESFTAAFMLGMKQYFGNVDHLKATISEVPVDGSDYRKQYLVIYDSVPGGTGYLKQLMNNKDSLVTIFEKALEVLENCSCKDSPEKDGCYHCLYAYRQSNNIGSVSRKAAIEMIKAILSGKDNLEEIDKLGNVDTNSLFDSELERKFIEVLSRIGNTKGTVSVENALVREKKGYLLKAGKSVWEIEPQVNLGPSENVSVYCKPDFVIWPVTKDDRKPVAIFTDGYRYHKDICADDTLKREAIRRSGDFRVWSLSYSDVENIITPQGDFASNVLEHSAMPAGNTFYNQFVRTFKAESIAPATTDQVNLLIEYLANDNAEQVFTGQARAYASSLLDPTATKQKAAFESWNKEVDYIMNQTNIMVEHHDFGETLFGRWRPQPQNPFLTIHASIQKADAIADKYTPASIYAVLDDSDTEKVKYKEDWNGLWHFFNVMQFAPKFIAVSKSGLDNGTYMSLAAFSGAASSTPAASATGATGWDNVIKCLFDDEAKDMAQKLIKLEVTEPDEIGLELEDSSGAVIAEIEMAWTGKKVAYMTECQLDDKESVESQGWTVITNSSEIDESIWR